MKTLFNQRYQRTTYASNPDLENPEPFRDSYYARPAAFDLSPRVYKDAAGRHLLYTEMRNTNLIITTKSLKIGTLVASHAPLGAARNIPFSRPMSVEAMSHHDKSAFVSLVNDLGEQQTMSVSLDHIFEIVETLDN